MSLTEAGPLGSLVLAWIDRAVHGHDADAVDELVTLDFVGHGFAADREALRAFYVHQARVAPDWRIDVVDLVEEGDRVAVRAHAYGTRAEPGEEPGRRDVEWIAIYRFEDGRIAELWVCTRDL